MKNEAILRDVLPKWKVECRADGLVPMRFAIFPVHLSKLLRLPRKSDARSYEVLHLSRKIISANLKIWWTCLLYCACHGKGIFADPLQMSHASKPSRFALAQSLAPATRNDIWTSKNGPNPWCFVHFDFEMCFAPQRRALFRHLNLQKRSEREVFFTFSLANVLRATTACTFSTSQLPKVVQIWCVLYILTSKCASRHNGVHFFDISTSKSGPNVRCFSLFHLQMCFAPQRRALFRHRNFQKWFKSGVFCTFWLRNVLHAPTVCTFSTSQLPKAVRERCVLYILPSKCASRHNGVQFFISHLARWLRTRRFSEPTFRPSGATNHWKNTVFRDFPTFSRICIFFLLTLSLLWSSLSSILLFSLTLPISAFHLSILSEVWLLNFLRLFIPFFFGDLLNE